MRTTHRLLFLLLLGYLFSGCKDSFEKAEEAFNKEDYKEASRLYQESCDDGNFKGCGILGSMYLLGAGVEKDNHRAAELLKKSCDGGAMESCVTIGSIAMVAKYYKAAGQYYQKACDGGNMLGCNELASLYEEGNGVYQNTQRAVDLYKKACNGGYDKACVKY